MNIWESAGYWYANDGGREYQFDSEQEARQAMAKIEMAKEIVRTVQALAPVMDAGPDLIQEYYDAGSLVDEDVAALGLTAQDVISCVIVLEQIGKFANAQAVATDAYRVTINKVRRVSA